MYQIIVPFIFMIVAFFTTSCSGEDVIGDKNQAKKGEYMMRVKQSGDIESFDISASFTGGNGVNSGILNEESEDLGFSYSLSSEESKQTEYCYKTTFEGVVMIYTLLATCSDLSKKLDVEISLYFNKKLVDIRQKSFRGSDTSPWSVTWSQVK